MGPFRINNGIGTIGGFKKLQTFNFWARTLSFLGPNIWTNVKLHCPVAESSDIDLGNVSGGIVPNNGREALSIVAMLFGPDQRGLVARVAGWVYERDGNILHADQHRDAEENVFFQRIEWSQPGDLADLRRAATAFLTMARETLGMTCRVAVSSDLALSKSRKCRPSQPISSMNKRFVSNPAWMAVSCIYTVVAKSSL